MAVRISRSRSTCRSMERSRVEHTGLGSVKRIHRDARPIHPERWQAADPESHIGADEDNEGDQPVELGLVHARDAASAPPGTARVSMMVQCMARICARTASVGPSPSRSPEPEAYPPVSRRSWLLLTALVAALAIVTTVWVSIDRRPPESDHANHLERALRCHRILADGAPHPLQAILLESSFYPPLVPCLTGLLYFAAPVVPLTAQAVMLAFLALGVAAVFGLGRQLQGVETGLLAALFFATAPFVILSLTNFQLDLPLAAMVALTLYVLARADGFARGPWCVALGAGLGLGMLTKPTFATYVLPAMLWSAWSARRAPDRRRRL